MTDFFQSPLSRRIQMELDTYLARAKERDPQAGAALVTLFVESVRAKKDVDRRLMSFVAGALSVGLATGKAKDAWKALGLVRKRAGNPGTPNHFRRLTNSGRDALRLDITWLLDQGWKPRFIVEALAEEHKMSEEAIRYHYKQVKQGR